MKAFRHGFLRMDRTLDSYLEYSALEKKLAFRTISAYGNDLKYFNNWLSENGCELPEATAADIAEYMVFLSLSGFSPVSIKRKLSTIRGYYKYMQSSELRNDNPAELIHSPKQSLRLPHAVSVETVAALIDCLLYTSPSPRDS